MTCVVCGQIIVGDDFVQHPLVPAFVTCLICRQRMTELAQLGERILNEHHQLNLP